jgi:hypothetical protein
MTNGKATRWETILSPFVIDYEKNIFYRSAEGETPLGHATV